MGFDRANAATIVKTQDGGTGQLLATQRFARTQLSRDMASMSSNGETVVFGVRLSDNQKRAVIRASDSSVILEAFLP